MKKKILVFLIATIACISFGVFIDRNDSALAVSPGKIVWDGGFGFGLVKGVDDEIDLYNINKEEFNKGELNISINYSGVEGKEFNITPLLNGEPIKVNFNGEGFSNSYKINLKSGKNIINIKTDNIGNGVLSFILKYKDTVFGIYGYTDYKNINKDVKEIKYDKLETVRRDINKEVIGKAGEEGELSFKVKLDKIRFDGNNYGYKVFIGDELIKVDDKWGKIFKAGRDIFQDKFKFTLPNEKGEHDLYIVRTVNPISNTQPFEELVFKTKVIVK